MLDNLKAHKSPRVAEILARKSVWSNICCPIAGASTPLAISKLKSALRKLRAVTGRLAVLEGCVSLSRPVECNHYLVTGHMAGMIGQPALPVWVGTLIAGYALAPAQAGGLATLFLLGVVISSVVLSPFFHRMPGRWMPTLGFGVSAAAFWAMVGLPEFGALAILHFIAGFATGLA